MKICNFFKNLFINIMHHIQLINVKSKYLENCYELIKMLNSENSFLIHTNIPQLNNATITLVKQDNWMSYKINPLLGLLVDEEIMDIEIDEPVLLKNDSFTFTAPANSFSISRCDSNIDGNISSVISGDITQIYSANKEEFNNMYLREVIPLASNL